MRILYLHQHFSPPDGAGNNRSLELATHWVTTGHEVTIVCGSGNFKEPIPFFHFYKTYQIAGIRVVRMRVSYSHYASFPRRIVSFLHFLLLAMVFTFKFRKTDVVYASSTPLTVGIAGIWFKRVLGKRMVFETVDLWPDVPIGMGIVQNKWIIKLLYRLEKWIYREASSIVCLSEGMQELIGKKGIPSSKITVSHNGTNCETFVPAQDKTKAKQALGYKQTDFVVLYAGTIGFANGLEFLVDLASELQDSRIQFIVLGNGNRQQEVMHYAQQKQVRNLVFKEAVPKEQVSHYFNAADVGAVIFASYPILETNSANKFYDYLAAGLPVVINYEGWQKRYLSQYDCGYSNKDIRSLAQWLRSLAKAKILYEHLSQNARSLALNTFDRKKIAANLLLELNKGSA